MGPKKGGIWGAYQGYQCGMFGWVPMVCPNDVKALGLSPYTYRSYVDVPNDINALGLSPYTYRSYVDVPIDINALGLSPKHTMAVARSATVAKLGRTQT